MLISMCLHAPCHAYVLRSILVAMPCATLALFAPYYFSFLCRPLLVGCKSRSCMAYIRMPRTILKGLDHFLYISMFACLHLYLYLHVSLSRSRFCHALCPLWVCACVVISVPSRVYMDVATCEIHLRGVGVLDLNLSLFYAMLLCLPCLLCAPIWLSLLLYIFVRLPICSCMSLCVVHTPIQWKYGHSIQTYICPPRTPPYVW